MKLAQNIKAISRLSLILLLLISFVIGGFLSYLWVMGYVTELGIRVPEKTTVAITNVSFTPQNTSFFNVTLLNPSYSPSEANIIGIVPLTGDGKIHNITTTDPPLPQKLPDGYNQTIQCFWNWANYTGQTIGITAFIEDGSGPTFEALTPFVGLNITDVYFNSSISFSHFNLTIQSHENSVTYVNVTDIKVETNTLKAENVTPSLPYTLNPNSSVTFNCRWDWTEIKYQNASITIAVHTLQGYFSNVTYLTPKPIVAEVTDVLFFKEDVSNFNLTIRNSELSQSYLTLSRVTVTLENGTVVKINGTKMKPSLPYTLTPNSSATFKCPWNWNAYRNKNAILNVHTLQNYTIPYITITPSPVKIINATFDPANTNSFNLTVKNSEFYTTYVNLTDVTLVLENGTIHVNRTQTTPPLDPPYKLEPSFNVTLICTWNWSNYQGKNVTIIIQSAENYLAKFTKVTPTRVFFAIVSVVFDPIDTENFKITVRNSESSLDKAYISNVTLTLKNGTIIEISDVIPILPHPLDPNFTVTFYCSWDWTNYRNENITITVYARKEYIASTQYTTPPRFH